MGVWENTTVGHRGRHRTRDSSPVGIRGSLQSHFYQLPCQHCPWIENSTPPEQAFIQRNPLNSKETEALFCCQVLGSSLKPSPAPGRSEDCRAVVWPWAAQRQHVPVWWPCSLWSPFSTTIGPEAEESARNQARG